MKYSIVALAAYFAFVMFMTSKSSSERALEQDTVALAKVIAQRLLCDVSPAYSGLDLLDGRHAVYPPAVYQQFEIAFRRQLADAERRLNALTAEQQKQVCVNLQASEAEDAA